MFRKQFLFTKKHSIEFDWEKKEVGNWSLFSHPDLESTHIESDNAEIILLGSLYDWEKPHYSNVQIVEQLLKFHTIETIFSGISKYCGSYVLIFKTGNRLVLFNDTCSQSEIYYTSDYLNFSSQPKLLAKVSNSVTLHSNLFFRKKSEELAFVTLKTYLQEY